MKEGFRKLAVALCVPLPRRLKLFVYRHVLGWAIGQNVSIGLSYIDARQVEIGDHVRIGHFNVFRNLRALQIGERAIVGQWNWLTSASRFTDIQGAESLAVFCLGRHSALTSRHYVDCAGGVWVGEFTIIAGVRSTFLTHQADMVNAYMTAEPIYVGNYCFVASAVCVAPGALIPDRSVVGMGAVVASSLGSPGMLYGGVPAQTIKAVEGAYFHRTKGELEKYTGGRVANTVS